MNATGPRHSSTQSNLHAVVGIVNGILLSLAIWGLILWAIGVLE